MSIQYINWNAPDNVGNFNLKVEHVEGLQDALDNIETTPGPQGIQGEQGVAGERGLPGVDGKDGVDGLPGRDGNDGSPGRDGVDGKDGVDGLPGLDGSPGVDGKDGRDGVDGLPGADGKDGVDGVDSTNLYLNSGLLSAQTKIFAGEAVTVGTDGSWSLEIGSAEFQNVFNVQVTVQAGSFSQANAPLSSNVVSVTNTVVTGKAFKATSAGLLAAMQQTPAEPGTKLYVLVIGV